MTSDAVEIVTYTTPAGSVVSLPFLTPEQRDAAVENLSPDHSGGPEAAEKGATCTQCQGAGGWNERREQKTSKGGTVVVTVWVNCRPCGGTGKR
ncbi:hypothetical protein [Streptosporangium sp. NPDC004631]